MIIMEDVFKAIANEIGCEYSKKDEKYLLPTGSSLPISTYKLTVSHKGNTFWLKNTFGNSDRGELELYLPKLSGRSEFEITTKSHFMTLFSKKKQRLNISCEDETIVYILTRALNASWLNEYLQKAAFDPYIKGENVDGKFRIRTEYHLIFEGKHEVIKPLINFYKTLIEEIRI